MEGLDGIKLMISVVCSESIKLWDMLSKTKHFLLLVKKFSGRGETEKPDPLGLCRALLIVGVALY